MSHFSNICSNCPKLSSTIHSLLIQLLQEKTFCRSKMSKSQEKKGNRHLAKCASAYSWYKGFTSLGGLTQARGSDNRVSITAWLIIFSFGCILTFITVNDSVTKFLKYEVTLVYDVVNMLILCLPSFYLNI